MIGILISIPLYAVSMFLFGMQITAGIFIFHVAVVPIIFKYSNTFRRSLIFANFGKSKLLQWPFPIDYENPSSCGIEGARNLTLHYHSKVDNCPVSIGIWHILPVSSYERLRQSLDETTNKVEKDRIMEKDLLTSQRPVIMYCHGNSKCRASWHRIQLYKFFQNMNFHTIAFDYRGYGDSTNVSPSEPGVVEDSLMVYEWLNSTISGSQDKPHLFIWGHSLGTGISSHLLGNLKELTESLLKRGEPLPLPSGLILEAPFNNLADEVAKHPLSKLVTWLPYYESTFVDPFKISPLYSFKSDEYLSKQKSLPILILHAKDDVIVPFVVGMKLYESIADSRRDGGGLVQLHAYERCEGLGHKWICRAKDLNRVVGFLREKPGSDFLLIRLHCSVFNRQKTEVVNDCGKIKCMKFQ